MKTFALILLFVFGSIECRKIVPINKNANIDFINMESGGRAPTPGVPAVNPKPAPVGPGTVQGKPVSPTPAPTVAPTTKSPVAAASPPKPVPGPQPMTPNQPKPQPAPIKPVPVNPAPVVNPITTPGPGSVKSLVNFYNSQGQASPIRPYSYSQAVKQG